MKKSLKTSVQIFGAAGLVLLAGCGADTTVTEPIIDSAEVMEEGSQKMMEDSAVKEPVDGVQEDAAADAAMDDTVIKDEKVEEVEAMEGAVEDAAASQDITVSYTSPAGAETIAVSMVIVEGAVASISAVPSAKHDVSKKWQTAFAGGLSAAAVGKSLSEIAGLDAVGGASLTTGGFKEAVASL